jgi:hypothetical protein
LWHLTQKNGENYTKKTRVSRSGKSECGMRKWEVGMRNAEVGSRNAEVGMRNADNNGWEQGAWGIEFKGAGPK